MGRRERQSRNPDWRMPVGTRQANGHVSEASGLKGDAMSSHYAKFWSALPSKARHPLRVPILEALHWIGEPLSAIALVDVLDGHLTMWEAAHHLRVLDALDVAEPSSIEADTGASSRNGVFDVPYRLKDRRSGEGA